MAKPNPNADSLDEIIRVDHAGEYGANRIYEGQLLVLGKKPIAAKLRHMLKQEQEHLQKFNELIVEKRVRPSVLMPLWHIGGLALGVGSALLGEKAAMACTVAVEEVIDEHYKNQEPLIEDAELKATIQKFRAEEIEHRDTGLEHKAQEMPGYGIFTGIVKTISRSAIFLAKRF